MIVWGMLANRIGRWIKLRIKLRLAARKELKVVRRQIYARLGHPDAAMRSSVLK